MHKLVMFLPVKRRYDLIALFVGGNNLPTGTTRTLARNISELAVAASEVAFRVFVIAVPPRLDIHDQAKALIGLLESNNDRQWFYRSISRSIYGVKKHTTREDIHLDPSTIIRICSILRNRALRKPFCPQIAKRSHPRSYEFRRGHCTCSR